MNDSICAYILAGGKSSRFGSDKARAVVDGEPLICRVASIVQPLAELTVIADRERKYDDLGLKTIADLSPGLGPMAGLQTALHHCQRDWLLMLSCDLVNVQRGWLDALLAARHEAIDIVAFKQDFWEPLCALYHQRLSQEVDDRVRSGQLAMQSLLDHVRTVALARPHGWAQANTKEQLKDATCSTFEILVFGPLARAAGSGKVCVTTVGRRSTCGELRSALADQQRILAPLLPSCRFAVNGAFAPEDEGVTSTDEIALVGLVSGG